MSRFKPGDIVVVFSNKDSSIHEKSMFIPLPIKAVVPYAHGVYIIGFFGHGACFDNEIEFASVYGSPLWEALK